MTSLGLYFYTLDMSVTIPWEKLQDTLQLVEEWGIRKSANIYISAVGPPWHIAQ